MMSQQHSVSENNEWQRLSLVSVIYFIVKFTISSVKQWFLNIVPAIAVFATFVENRIFWLSIVIPMLLLLIIIFSFFYYWYFKFQTQEGQILIHRGVFKKERLNLQFTRVQNVNINTPFYFAPFKVVNCIIESAGSKSTEVNLPGVKNELALSIRSEVFAAEKKEPEKEEEDKQEENCQLTKPQPSGLMLKLSNWESAKYGLTSYFALVFIAVLAPFSEKIGDYVSHNVIPILMDIIQPISGNPIVSGIFLAVTSILVFITLITVASMTGALVRFYNFELYKNEDKLVRIAGLLERKSTTLTKIKVQSVLIKQNIVARLLNRVSLQYRQVGTTEAKANDSSIQIPMLKPEEINKYASIVFSNCPEPEFTGIHPSYISRVFLYYCLLPFAFIISIPVLFLSKFFLVTLVALAPIFVLLKLRYRRYGFWFNEEYGAIREGMFGHKIVIFPLYKVQLTKVRQSRGQKRRKVANLQVQLGSGVLSIPYLPIETLSDFVNLALYKTESSTKSWM